MNSQSLPLQELTRKLQEERDRLASQVEDLLRQLAKEQTVQLQLMNDVQMKELEVVHFQQLAHDQQANLLERCQQLEKELEAERAAHQLSQIAHKNAAAKVAKLTSELQQMESKWRKEMTKKDSLLSDLAQLQEQLRLLDLDRQQLIARTEADAKKVRELWKEILQEHEDHRNSSKQQLEQLQRKLNETQKSLVQEKGMHQNVLAVKDKLAHELQAVTLRLTQIATGKQEIRQELNQMQRTEKDLTARLADQTVLIERLSSKIELLRHNEQMTVKERQMAKSELVDCQRQLQDKSQELLVIKTEFSDLLDRCEHQTHEFKQKALERESLVKEATQKLRHDHLITRELVALLKAEVAGYRKMIRTLNNKLRTVRENVASSEMNSWQLTTPTAGASTINSLCIIRQ